MREVQREHGRVAAAAVLLKQHLFRHQGTVSAALVLGGVDVLGPHLYQVGILTTPASPWQNEAKYEIKPPLCQETLLGRRGWPWAILAGTILRSLEAAWSSWLSS